VRKAADAVRAGEDAVRKAADTVREAVDAVRRAADTVREAADTVREAADTVREAADTVREAADTVRKAADTVREAADTVRRAADTVRKAADTGRRAADRGRAGNALENRLAGSVAPAATRGSRIGDDANRNLAQCSLRDSGSRRMAEQEDQELPTSVQAGPQTPRRLLLRTADRNRATRGEIDESIGVGPFTLLQVLNQRIQVIADLTHHLSAKLARLGNDWIFVHFSPFDDSSLTFCAMASATATCHRS
jgi:uncharacterized protein YukE